VNFAAISKAAEKRGLVARRCTEHHWQIVGGPLLVNIWPSKGKVYVGGTQSSIDGYSLQPSQLVELAFTPPPMTGTDEKARHSKLRRKRSWKAKRVERGERCRWCGKPVTAATASLDHVVPLARGGLDEPNNWALAHVACNQARGHAMPEVHR
jgi:hypothetical protein